MRNDKHNMKGLVNFARNEVGKRERLARIPSLPSFSTVDCCRCGGAGFCAPRLRAGTAHFSALTKYPPKHRYTLRLAVITFSLVPVAFYVSVHL